MENAKTSLYQRLVLAGIECSSWQSDLYFPKTKETDEIVRSAAEDGVVVSKNVTQFRRNAKTMYEAPFCFDPYWESRACGPKID